jgi:hypothetical protein
MKNALLAAFIVGAAAAGVILYLTRKNGVESAIDDIADGANDARRIAAKHLRKTQRKANNMLHDTMQ